MLNATKAKLFPIWRIETERGAALPSWTQDILDGNLPMIGAGAVFILVLHANPIPERQVGPYQFLTQSACEGAAPDVIVQNRAAYPSASFTGFACLKASDDLR